MVAGSFEEILAPRGLGKPTMETDLDSGDNLI